MKTKKNIEYLLKNKYIDEAYYLIIENKKRIPFDIDYYYYEGFYYFLKNDYKSAINILSNGISINPYHINLNYLISLVYESNKDFLLAIKHYYMFYFLKENKTESDIKYLNILKYKYLNILKNQNSNDLKIKIFKMLSLNNFEVSNVLTWGWNGFAKPVGENLYNLPEYFIAEYSKIPFLESSNDKLNCVEIRKTKKQGKYIKINLEEEVLIPILLKNDSILKIYKNNELISEIYQNKNTFHYYKLKGNITFKSDSPIVLSEPIYLKNYNNNKKLVLNIFIDGLSKSFLEKHGFQETMPKTFEFFSDSIHCEKMYSTGEWTYPSMASYFSGLYSTNHKLFHPKVDYKFKNTIKLLAEYFKENNYNTVKIDGDWRTNPNYGHIKGFDRVLTGTYGARMNINEVITETIEHIEFMKESDQFVYINLAELHDISDNYKLPAMIQKNIALENRDNIESLITTSAKQNYDLNKSERYKKQLYYIDFYLDILFTFIQKNFKNDEILIVLFSDHGQSFLVPEKNFFLSDERIKVPLIIKGISKEIEFCNEPICNVDYLSILASILSFKLDKSNKDSKLPNFFAKNKKSENPRDFTVSESIFPGDTYKIAIHSKNNYFYLETDNLVRSDGRIIFTPFSYSLKNYNNESIQDKILVTKYIDFIKDHLKEWLIYE